MVIRRFASVIILLLALTSGASAYGPSGGGTSTGSINVTGPVSITGNQGNGSDKVNGVCHDGICPVEAFGASGSTAIGTCTGITGNTLTGCTGISDFVVHNGVEVIGAGGAAQFSSVTSLAGTVRGAGGLSSYRYKVCPATMWHGFTGACSSVTVGSAAATFDSLNGIELTWTRDGNPSSMWVIYRSVDAGVSYQYLVTTSGGDDVDITPQSQIPDTTQGWPATPPSGAVNDDQWSTVTSVTSNTLTLADTPGSTPVGSFSVYHDDSVAANAALTAAGAIAGEVDFGPHTYLTEKPLPIGGSYNGSATGVMLIPSNVRIRGAGRGVTFIQQTHATVPGVAPFGFYNGQGNPSTIYSGATKYPIDAAVLGQSFVHTTTSSNAANFVVGDYIFCAGGVVVNGTNASNQIRKVIAVDNGASSPTYGNIYFDQALVKPIPVGTAGEANECFKLTGAVIHDVTIEGLTVNAWAPAFYNLTAVDHLHMVEVDHPYHHNFNFVFYGGFIRDWTCDRCNWTDGGMEFDLIDDFRFSNGSWQVEGPYMITIDEGSADTQIDNSSLNISRKMCFTTNANCYQAQSNPIGTDGSTTNVRILNNNINVASGLNEVGDNSSTISLAPVAVAGYTPANYIVQGNTINFNTKVGILSQNIAEQQLIADNKLNYTANASAQAFVGVQIASGILRNNYLRNSNPDSGTTSPCYELRPPATSLPLNVTDNVCRNINTQSGDGILISPSGLYTGILTLAHNTSYNVTLGISNAGPTNLYNINSVFNSCVTCATASTPTMIQAPETYRLTISDGTTGTWFVPAGVTRMHVCAAGAQGGGGGCITGGSTLLSGGGGAAGSIVCGWYGTRAGGPALASSYAWSVAGGGTAGTCSGTPTAGNPGGNSVRNTVFNTGGAVAVQLQPNNGGGGNACSNITTNGTGGTAGGSAGNSANNFPVDLNLNGVNGAAGSGATVGKGGEPGNGSAASGTGYSVTAGGACNVASTNGLDGWIEITAYFD